MRLGGRGGRINVVRTREGVRNRPLSRARAGSRRQASLVASGRKERAMAIFTLNRQRHPDDNFVTYVGLARGYTAMGDTKKAIANWELALKNLPESQKPSLPVYEEALKALKEKGD